MPIKKIAGCITFPVAAAAYKVKAAEASLLTHSWQPEEGRVLCRRVKPESILDDYALSGQDEPPTCLECLRRDARFA